MVNWVLMCRARPSPNWLGRTRRSDWLERYLSPAPLVIDSITRHRTDGSFVRLIAPIQNGDEEKTLIYLKEFARLIFPILTEYIPS